LWIYTSLSKWRLLASDKYAPTLIFVTAVMLRMVPELAAYPYPMGYDVINYYIPVVAHFEQHWPVAASQFPLYVIILHFVNLATGLSAHSVVVAAAIIMFGVFGSSVFYIARSLLKLGVGYSVFLAVFVIIQMAVLRTAWDLHRDIFALATMMLAFCLVSRKDIGWKELAALLALSSLTVAADRMIGALFCMSLAAYAIATRRAVLPAVFSTGLFSALMIGSYAAAPGSEANAAGASAAASFDFYNPQNLLILFAVINGLLAVLAAIGLMNMKNAALLLKIPLVISLAGSFSWLAFPDTALFVADRWIIIAGIFLAIFAGYGIIHLIRNLKVKPVVAGSVLAAFAAVGLAYAVMPHDSPFVLYAAARASIENFGPVTMQFNALDIEDNDEILSTIAQINEDTEPDAVIVGEKHWRGFMEMYLEGQRTYRFSNDPQVLAEALDNKGKHAYLLKLNPNSPDLFVIEDVYRR
jgi:hypothetical protein